MKLNKEQEQYIHDYLKKVNVTKQEIHEEFYDHIVSAYEEALSRGSNQPLEAFVKEKIEEDFGGKKGLEKVMNTQQRLINDRYRKALMQEFRYFLKWPVILLSGGLYLLLYKLLLEFPVQKVIILSIGISSLIPIAIALFGLASFYIDCKRLKRPYSSSIKNLVLLNLGLLFGAIPNIYNGLFREMEITSRSVPLTILVALILTAYILMAMSYIRLLKKNFTFKLNLA